MEEEINNLREKIDEIDNKIIGLLRERFGVAKNIGDYKKKKGLPVRDLKREKEVIDRVIEKTKEQGIKDIEQIKKVYIKIMESCRDIQRK